jgi:hypothetical protein
MRPSKLNRVLITLILRRKVSSLLATQRFSNGFIGVRPNLHFDLKHILEINGLMIN